MQRESLSLAKTMTDWRSVTETILKKRPSISGYVMI